MSPWPVKEEDGVQLSYGIEGSVIYDSNSIDAKLVFANDRELGMAMYPINGGPRLLAEPLQLNDGDYLKTSRLEVEGILESIYVPDDIIKDYETDSKNFMSKISYVPTYGKLMDVGTINFLHNPCCRLAVANVSGELASKLSISLVGIDDKNHLMDLISSTSITLSSAIQQVSFCHLSKPLLSISSQNFLVRTSDIVDVFRVSGSNKFEPKLEKINELLLDEKIADMLFNPFNPLQFAVIDVKGAFSVWAVDTMASRLQFYPLPRACGDFVSMTNPAEFSSFKLVRWGNNPNSLFLIDRSIIQHYDLKMQKLTSLVFLGKFSSFKDYVRINENYAMLLTSKEIVLVQVLETNLRKIISWRHYLRDADPSLHLSITDLTMVNGGIPLFKGAILSSFNSIIINFHVAIKDGMFKWLGNPSVTILKENSLLKEICVIPFYNRELVKEKSGVSILNTIQPSRSIPKPNEEIYFVHLNLTTSLALSLETYSSKAPEPVISQLKDGSASHDSSQSIGKPDTSEDFRKLIAKLSLTDEMTDERIIGNQGDDIQELAYILGARLSEFVETKSTDIINILQLIDSETNVAGLLDVDEIDSMLFQLKEHFEALGLIFVMEWSMIPKEHINVACPVRSVCDWLMATYSDQQLKLNQTAIQLALSLTTFSRQEAILSKETTCVELLSGFPEDMLNILSEWGVDPTIEKVLETLDIPSSFQMPSINVSQSFKHSNIPAPVSQMLALHSQSSQESQSQVVMTQAERGLFGGRTIKKKKKKRLGGFA